MVSIRRNFLRGAAERRALGKTDTFEYGPEDWHFLPKYDIAVVQVPLDGKVHQYSLCQAPTGFAMPENIKEARLGPGEDVFMVGRFIDHDGGSINRPAVRFGNISVMPSPIEQPNGMMADCYCVDLHSRSGYSGSPVFAYRTPGFDLEQTVGTTPEDRYILLAGTNYLALLGIHFAQFPEEWEIGTGKPIRKKDSESAGAVPLIQEGRYVKGLSGMICVLPAWSIWEVLNMPILKDGRFNADQRIMGELASEGKTPPVAESVSPPANGENPTHREDFTRLVGAAARKPAQED
jgi:hypothetical protein